MPPGILIKITWRDEPVEVFVYTVFDDELEMATQVKIYRKGKPAITSYPDGILETDYQIALFAAAELQRAADLERV